VHYHESISKINSKLTKINENNLFVKFSYLMQCFFLQFCHPLAKDCFYPDSKVKSILSLCFK